MAKLVLEIDLDYFEGSRPEVVSLMENMAKSLRGFPHHDLRTKGEDGKYKLSARMCATSELKSEGLIGVLEVSTDKLMTYDVTSRPYKDPKEVTLK